MTDATFIQGIFTYRTNAEAMYFFQAAGPLAHDDDSNGDGTRFLGICELQKNRKNVKLRFTVSLTFLS
ncbi:hypothetical protein [Paenibacillus sp.]|jgi:hypothetical protein|uniref:hypothetical protein n=1 Tax=Paenibacillus sp. TaxID=58172 RepID=UPI00283AB649|nr:hypothetical protein [Paenibacillus sp.]